MEIKEAIYAVRLVYVSKCNAPCTMRQLAQKITVGPEKTWQKRRRVRKNINDMIFRQEIGGEEIAEKRAKIKILERWDDSHLR